MARTEYDTFGPIDVPATHFWNAQRERVLRFFEIGTEVMPREIIYTLTQIKQAAATVNCDLGTLEEEKARVMEAACDDILAGEHDSEFPLSIWQTDSGSQTNTNVNEVIANLASAKFPVTFRQTFCGLKTKCPNQNIVA
jgi:fumarate hydratase class II